MFSNATRNDIICYVSIQRRRHDVQCGLLFASVGQRDCLCGSTKDIRVCCRGCVVGVLSVCSVVVGVLDGVRHARVCRSIDLGDTAHIVCFDWACGWVSVEHTPWRARARWVQRLKTCFADIMSMLRANTQSRLPLNCINYVAGNAACAHKRSAARFMHISTRRGFRIYDLIVRNHISFRVWLQ